MGIAPYKTFTFDGVSSADYGVYITGEGVFNAPERAVEMVDIPGRNGSYALDQGRFGNIEVTYTAGMVDDSETNFADRLANVRNWLCSKKGYVRLEDDYNPDEYRMAVYSSGISVEHADLRTGEFEISFDCKPQRWLTSGETATAVANNGTLTNPTLFDAEPLLEVKGYGGIHFNGYSIDIQNVTLGNVIIADSNESQYPPLVYAVSQDIANNGDTIDYSISFDEIVKRRYANESITGTTTPSCTNADFQASINQNQLLTTTSGQFTFGTSSTVTNTVTGSITWLKGSTFTTAYTITQTIQYDASAKTITISSTGTYVRSNDGQTYDIAVSYIANVSIICHSTVSALGNPTYIDCEIGEAYMIKNGNIVSCNQAVALGSDLPKLAPGANTITFDNTITELKIHPRWWRV